MMRIIRLIFRILFLIFLFKSCALFKAASEDHPTKRISRTTGGVISAQDRAANFHKFIPSMSLMRGISTMTPPISRNAYPLMAGLLLIAGFLKFKKRIPNVSDMIPQCRHEDRLTSSHQAPRKWKNLTAQDIHSYISKTIVGNEQAITIISTEIEFKLLADETKPLCICLPGVSGVGKTEICRQAAASLSAEFLKLDGGEFGNENGWRLFGSDHGYCSSEDGGRLPNTIRKAKNSGAPLVVLFDEFDKFNQQISQRILHFIDEGVCGDAIGQVRAPKDTVIFFASNHPLDTTLILDDFGAREWFLEKRLFSSEFLGRIDRIVPIRHEPAMANQLTARALRNLCGALDIRVSIDSQTLSDLVHWTNEYLQNGRDARYHH